MSGASADIQVSDDALDELCNIILVSTGFPPLHVGTGRPRIQKGLRNTAPYVLVLASGSATPCANSIVGSATHTPPSLDSIVRILTGAAMNPRRLLAAARRFGAHVPASSTHTNHQFTLAQLNPDVSIQDHWRCAPPEIDNVWRVIGRGAGGVCCSTYKVAATASC